MAEIKNFPNNVDEYIGAENVMKWLHGRTSGVFAAENNLAVTSQGGMNLAVSDGVGWIANSESDGTVFWNDAFKTTGTELALSLELADAYNPRIDRVVVSWETVDYTDRPEIKVLKGTPAGTPAAPALTRTASKWEISLAQIYVGAAVSAVTAANITDERLNAAVCGLVTATLEIDSTMANNQFVAALQELQQQISSTITNTQTQASSVLTTTQTEAAELLDAIETELADLNAGTAAMLKSVYDKDNDGHVDDAVAAQAAAEAAQATATAAQTAASTAQSTADSAATAASAAQSTADTANTTANAALPKSGGAMTGTLSDPYALQVRNSILTPTDQTVGASSSYPNGTLIHVYEA